MGSLGLIDKGQLPTTLTTIYTQPAGQYLNEPALMLRLVAGTTESVEVWMFSAASPTPAELDGVTLSPSGAVLAILHYEGMGPGDTIQAITTNAASVNWFWHSMMHVEGEI